MSKLLLKKLIKGTPAEKEEYSNLVVKFIREKYSLNDELAIMRQATTKPAEFAEYNEYVEACKAKAKAQLGNV